MSGPSGPTGTKRKRVPSEQQTGGLEASKKLRVDVDATDDLAFTPDDDSVSISGCTDTSTDASGPHSNPSTRPSTPGDAVPKSTKAPSSQQAGQPRQKKHLCDFPDCGKAYSRPILLVEHQRTHTGEKPLLCPYDDCDKAFAKDGHLKAHVKSKHQDVRNFVCQHADCGKSFHTGQRLKAHAKLHDQDRPQYRCTAFPPCQQDFRKQETLDRHVQLVHLDGKPYVCDKTSHMTGQPCNASFKTSTQLISHVEREHSGNRFFCRVCSPQIDAMDPVLNQDLFRTAVGFPTYVEMQEHVKILHPPTCDQCGHVCASNKDLKAHKEIQHDSIDDRRNYVCDYPDCGRGFTRKGNMQVHMRTVHAQQRQYTCGQVDIKPCKRLPDGWDGRGACGRSLGTKAALEEHIRTQHLHLPGTHLERRRRLKQEHDDSTNVSMQDCQPKSRSTLDMLTGAGYERERDIACVEEYCPHRFMRLYDLEVHLQAVHAYSTAEAIELIEWLEQEQEAERAFEQEALTGGDFWIGGSGEQYNQVDAELAHQLSQALEQHRDVPAAAIDPNL